ncbi:hypothetical protein PV05_08518 [Exophiala xenobiotica]|uniref:PBP domain-containing protein n=1 Tax=Exophiala xenobiotica TaxID=348802 RepID=A0A0D2EYS0_9EURO|nr:uncharacterized protein PV05_08518 [Exophiala xenobiotica]KIW52909.1 hypothetical protein PV05_08518 [Exophiala xenobiotica]
MASIRPIPSSVPKSQRQSIPPAALYGTPGGEVRLRIATGGAGQSGLLQKLAEEFIDAYTQRTSTPPFQIAWIATDTSLSFNALATGAADLSITYHPYAEAIALRQGIATRSVYAWRDHFMLVGSSLLDGRLVIYGHVLFVLELSSRCVPGPRSNPANLPVDQTLTINELFALVFQAAVETSTSPEPVKFLSRYDKSANNIRESNIWSSIGQTPWSHPYSSWYHRYIDFPFGALRAASRLGEYTLVDRGTWYAVGGEVRNKMMVFKESFDAQQDDPLINPAHALVGSLAKEGDLAEAFADWLSQADGGQKVIRDFATNGTILYSPVRMNAQPQDSRKRAFKL